MAQVLRITASGGTEYVARLVYNGDAYGDGHQHVHDGYQPLVEFVLPTGGGGRTVGVFPLPELPPLSAGWSPNAEPTLALQGSEIERLQRWFEDPSSESEDGVAVLVGYDDELAKAAVALRRIGLDSMRVPDAGKALAMARLIPPTLVVVGQDVLSVDPLDLVRRLRGAPETADIPVIVVGGDPDEATAAGASLHMETPPDYGRLTERTAELLDFV